ncbi:MAG: hypothetical protein ACI9U2_004169 [Bradymonadia bacterium]|jgi:hypothetical protein
MPWRLLSGAPLFALLVLCFGLTACDESTEPEGPGAVTQPPTPPPESTDAPYLNAAIFPVAGATEFTTANSNELLSAGTSGRTGQIGGNGRDLAPSADSDGDGVAEDGGAADPAAPGVPEAVPDVNREIVEADVFKLEGDLLYVLNRYRGLVIIDVSDPDNLRVRGRLPFQAIPVEMYVRDGRAYVLSSDYFQYWQYDPEADPHGFHGSQVMVLDVDDPDAPTMLGGFEVDGELTDSRMVGDVLYTVSKRRPDYWRYNTADWEDRTWILSINVADPANIREIDRLTFDGMSTLIHVAHHAIFVAALDPNYYLRDPNFPVETLVTYVDISDADGALQQRGRVYVPGHISDKFKMDWFEGTFRVLSHTWSRANFIRLSTMQTALPDSLGIDADFEIPVHQGWGSMRASRFEGERAFIATTAYDRNRANRWINELHTLDLSDALAPSLSATIEIDHDVNHFEVHDDRLLAVGRQNTNQSRRTTIGLYDVSDLAAPAPLSVEPIGGQWSNSEANYDYKAFKTFPDQGLILLPINYWDNGTSFTGVGILDWQDDQISERGLVANPGGVRRAFPVGDRIVAVGELSLSTIDLRDRDAPTLTDTLHLVRNVHAIFKVQGKQVQLLTDVYGRGARVEVRPFSAQDDSPAEATLELPFRWQPNVYRDGDLLRLIGFEDNNAQVVRTLDLTDVLQPRLRGELVIPTEFQRVYNQGYSFYARYWSPSAGLPLNSRIFPITHRHIVEDANGRRDFESALRFIDLRDIDNPRIADGSVPMNEYPFVNKVTHGDVLHSSHTEQATSPDGDSLLYHVRTYVDRVDVSDPDSPVMLPSLNVPGYLVDTSDDGTLLYTVDYQWDDFGRRRNSLNVLRVMDDVAQLVEIIPVGDQIHRAALRPGHFGRSAPAANGRPVGWDDRTVWLATHKYPWWGVRSDTVSSRQPYTHLRKLTFAQDGAVATDDTSTLFGYHFNLLDIEDGRAYLGSTGPYGLLVLDVTDPANTVIEFAARTIGYLSRLVVHDNAIYAPLGMFGVHRHLIAPQNVH